VRSFAREGQPFPGSDVHCFTLVPIGAGRSRTRRETFKVLTGGATSHGTTTYPSVVVEAPLLSEPLRVVLSIEAVQKADHQLDALVAFANRP
jgi:hypothetical protein